MSETTENRPPDFFTPVRFGILLALLVFAAFPQVLLGLQTFVVRDYGFFAYPLAHFQRECFWRGELPFWDPLNNCGVPFLAQWNTMPLYLPALIYLLLPLTWALSFFCLLHLWFAGLGMFFLAHRWSGNYFAAAFAGVAFAFNGFTLNLLMWPSQMATFAWMPWVVLAVELAWRDGGRKIFPAAFAGAMQMLAGGPEIIFMTWTILLALWVQQFVIGGRDTSSSPRGALLWRFPLIVMLVIALSAAQLLPFLDLVAHSQREAGYADLRWSMPGWGWANFLVPMAFGGTWNAGVFFQYGQSWTSSYYLGIGTLWLALLAFWVGRDSVEFKSKIQLLGIIATVGLVLALGENTPVLPAIRKLIPQLSFITYPIKYVLLVVFLAPLLAAFALARFPSLASTKGGEGRGEEADDLRSPYLGGAGEKILLRRLNIQTARLLAVGLTLLTLIAGILFWAWRFPFPSDNVHTTFLNGLSRGGFLILTGGLLLVLARKNQPRFHWIAPLLLILVAWLDVLTHEPTQNPTVQPWIYQPGLSRTKLALQPQPELGGSRIMLSPMAANGFVHFASGNPQDNFLAKRVGYCADVNTLDAVPKVDGFFSLTPRESDDVLALFYRTTNASFPRLEDFMGVSQITAPGEMLQWQPRSSFLPLVTAGQNPVFIDETNMESALTSADFDGGKIVFLPASSRPLVTATNQTSAKILVSRFGTQSVDVEADAAEPSLVVVAQTYYHNWHAYVDNQPAALLRANHAFQAVQIPNGTHKIHLAYEDRAFRIGAVISGAMWISCLAGWLLFRTRPGSPGKNRFRVRTII
jgi:hypothetical protein